MKEKLIFNSSKQLKDLINDFFNISHETENKKTDQANTPPTLSGLAFHLGFESRRAFEEYEQNGKYAYLLRRSRLRIETEYEKQLHKQPSTGAIFALKSMGWNEKPEATTVEKLLSGNIKIEITQAGPVPASSESEVDLNE